MRTPPWLFVSPSLFFLYRVVVQKFCAISSVSQVSEKQTTFYSTEEIAFANFVCLSRLTRLLAFGIRSMFMNPNQVLDSVPGKISNLLLSLYSSKVRLSNFSLGTPAVNSGFLLRHMLSLVASSFVRGGRMYINLLDNSLISVLFAIEFGLGARVTCKVFGFGFDKTFLYPLYFKALAGVMIHCLFVVSGLRQCLFFIFGSCRYNICITPLHFFSCPLQRGFNFIFHIIVSLSSMPFSRMFNCCESCFFS